MTNAIPLCCIEPQGIVTTQGTGCTGKSCDGQNRVNESFKKKLEAFGAMAAPVQQTPPDSGNDALTAGMQDGLEGLSALTAAACNIEGIELPVNPQATAELLNAVVDDTAALQTAAFAAAQTDAMANGANGTAAGQNAGMQTANAGERPAMTQDQILESVGAYLDEALGLQEETSQDIGLVGKPAEEAGIMAQVFGEAAETVQSASGTEAKEQTELLADDVFPRGMEVEKPLSNEGVKAVEGNSKEFAIEPEKADGGEKPEKTDGGENAAAVRSGTSVQEAQKPAATAQTQETAKLSEAEKAQYARDNVLRIVDSVSTKSTEGRHEFEVELKPEFLGKVRIKLTMERGSIHMLIHAEDPAVRQMLSDHSPDLVGALKDKGIALTGMDVSYESPAAFDGQSQQPSGGKGNGRQGGMRALAQTETRAEQSWDAFSLYAGNSTVEFFA